MHLKDQAGITRGASQPLRAAALASTTQMAQCIFLGHMCQHDAHMRTEGMGAGEGREQTETDSHTCSARHMNATRDKPAGVAKAAAHRAL